MKRSALFILLGGLIFSCQKGIHWDISSAGSLGKDINGNCLPVSVNGRYVADSTITADNFITVEVNVTATGSYSIYTDSANGYLFKADGEFTKPGLNQVKLACYGRPLTEGTDFFTIHYDTSICQVAVLVHSNAIPDAIFSMQGAPGQCLNDSVIGTFIKGVALDTSDKVRVSVNVTSTGKYDLNTSTVNGYSFSATGTFSTTGIQMVTLNPTGTPQNEATDVFIVNADSSACSFEVQVKSDAAEFTLQQTSGTCMNYTVTGTYVKDIYLDTFSKVSISVDVTSPGRYNLTTNVANGYSFSAIGIFTSTGVQTITMYAQGQPLNAGTDIFNLTAGASACSFEVTVLSGFVTVTSDDYFPLTDGSYWTYDDLFTKGNSIQRSINGTSSVNDTAYSIMQQTDNFGTNDQLLFRRRGADYLEYAREDKFTGSFQYAKNIFTDHVFLNQNVQQGYYWESPVFEDVSTFNQVLFLKYGYKCLKSNGVVAVNGKVFANVCIIEMRPQIHATANPWGYTNEIYTYYYAKGVGLIYYHAVSNFGYRKAEWQISSWLVN